MAGPGPETQEAVSGTGSGQADGARAGPFPGAAHPGLAQAPPATEAAATAAAASGGLDVEAQVPVVEQQQAAEQAAQARNVYFYPGKEGSEECGGAGAEAGVGLRSESQKAAGTPPLPPPPPRPSLDDLNSSVSVPSTDATWVAKLAAFLGMGAIVAVGYMDPGNWATSLEAGSKFGYSLLSAILISSLLSLFLQHLALKLGAASDMDLAQACHSSLSPLPNALLWIITEVAIAATDLVGVLGSATALNLLFGLPVWAGVLITAFDVLILLLVLGRSMRLLEAVVLVLCLFIAGSLVYELVLAKPDWALVFLGFVPQGVVFQGALFNAVAILGATVMPHNLYLHSSVIQTRDYPRTLEGRRMAIRFGTVDSVVSILLASLVMCFILIISAAVFYYTAHQEVVSISDAYRLLSPVLGQNAARIVFAVALLVSGQSASIAGTLAGQIVMEGFVEMKVTLWVRRIVTRLITLVPAMVAALAGGSSGTGSLLVLSQVVLSIQLPFAVGPLVHFTSSQTIMDSFANTLFTKVCAWIAFSVISGLNLYLVVQGCISLASS